MFVKTLAAAILFAAAGFAFWWFIQSNTVSPNAPINGGYSSAPETLNTQPSQSAQATANAVPSAIEADTTKNTVNDVQGNVISVANELEPTENLLAQNDEPNVTEQTAAYEIAQTELSETSIQAYLQLLKNDSALLAATIDEFRAELDPKRKKRLALLLGELAGPEVHQLASELLYSGSNTAQMDGLDLLGRIQGTDPNSFDSQSLVVDLLSSATDSNVLVGAINVMGVPGANANELRQSVLNQLTPLASSDSADVRRQSLSVLARWSNDADIVPLLTTGLSDQNADVRQAAAYAMGRNQHLDAEAIQGLFTILENTDESVPNRRAAARALNKSGLTGADLNRLNVSEKALNTRR